MTTGPLAEAVVQVCERLLPALDPPARDEVRAVRAGLTDVLRVAVVGRVNAGKSTVVNALIGRRVAPTDETECTMVTTWFRYGHPERVDVEFRDRSPRRSLQLAPDGMLPRTLGVDVGTVRALHVWLSIDTLRQFTLVDTPGRHGLKAAELGAHAVDAEHGPHEAAGAQAVAFLINKVVREDDLDALRTFRAIAAGSGNCAVNAIAVLNKADLVGGDDPWKSAVELAARHADNLRGEVATVIPLIGLLAESAVTGHLTEADVDALRSLAALDAEEREDLLFAVEDFVSYPCDVPADARSRLVRLLGIHGLRRAIDSLTGGGASATQLRLELERISNLAALTEALVGNFQQRGDALKATHALGSLRRIGFGPPRSPARDELLTAVEALEDSPAMHALRELRVEQYIASGEVELPGDLLADFRRITGPGTLAERLGVADADGTGLAEAARAGARRWRTYAQASATARLKEVSAIVDRSYFLALKEVLP